MQTVQVRGVTIGEGIPKICVPIVGTTREEILEAAQEIRELPADVVEWRVDWFAGVSEPERVEKMLAELRERLGELPLLFTFRTRREGGEREISDSAYRELNCLASSGGCIDLLDVEIFSEEGTVEKLVEHAHQCGVRVIASSHDFHGTPDKEEIIRRLQYMQEKGADILKVAVMPKGKQDVLTLLAATEEMQRLYAERPLITMSMAGDGVISRLSGEVFGSALTFGAAGKASAPGQMHVRELRQVLEILHHSLG